MTQWHSFCLHCSRGTDMLNQAKHGVQFLKKNLKNVVFFLFILVPIVSANIFSPVFNSGGDLWWHLLNCHLVGADFFLLKCFLTNRQVNLLLKFSIQIPNWVSQWFICWSPSLTQNKGWPSQPSALSPYFSTSRIFLWEEFPRVCSRIFK